MTIEKILQKIIILVVGGALTFFPSKSNAQGPPVDLPLESRVSTQRYDNNVWVKVDGEWQSYSPTVLPLMNTLKDLDEITITLAPYKSNAQFPELPSELRGFVEPQEIVIDSLFAYNTRNDSLLDGTVLSLADTVTAEGDTVPDVPNFYRFVIPTDKASTPNIVEGATAGDTLYFEAKVPDGSIYPLIPIAGAVIHEPGKIKRKDLRVDKPVAVGDPPRNIPEQFRLHQNYPNPFNPTTTIKYNLKQKADVLLEVYNITGQKVRTLVDEQQNVGEHKVIFDGKDTSSGVYFVRMRAGKYIETKKMLLMK